MFHTFHCKKGEYKALTDRLLDRWIIARTVFARGEWHVTAVTRAFIMAQTAERRERIMQRLAS